MKITRIKTKNFVTAKDEDFEFNKFNTAYNDGSKTVFLKAIYATIRALQEDKKKKWSNIERAIKNKLSDTFFLEGIEEIEVYNPGTASVRVEFDNGNSFEYEIEKTAKKLNIIEHNFKHDEHLALYIPPNDIINFSYAIRDARAKLNRYFDSTYMDLQLAIEVDENPSKDKNLLQIAEQIVSLAGGELKNYCGQWKFIDSLGKQYPISIVSREKLYLATFARLIKNKMIAKDMVLFVDTPNLQDEVALRFTDILFEMSAKLNIQIFLSANVKLHLEHEKKIEDVIFSEI